MTLLAALGGAAAISFSAIFFELAGVSPVTGAFFRAAYALPVLGVIWWLGRRSDHRPWHKRSQAVVGGLVLGLDVVFWHTSIHHIGAGLATLLANSQVVFVAVSAWLLLGERPPRKTLVAIPVVMIGVAMVSGLGRGDAFGDNPVFGTLLALLAAVFYAVFILLFRSSNEARVPPAGPLLEATTGLLISASLVSLVTGDLVLTPSWPAHGWLIALALGAQVGGWLLIGYALPRLPAVETATIILLQPMLTMVWGALIFAERPSAIQLVGALIVLGGVGFVAVNSARRPTPSAAPA
jgi:drug/metabolite transporter (DMT)-like permease